MNYKSPIEIIVGQLRMEQEKKLEGDIFRAIQEYGITVDKEELIKALQYDRHQYEKGYKDGYDDGGQKLEAEKEEFRKFVHAAFEEAKTYYAEGVKKMQEKLKSTFCPDADYFGCDIHSAINEKAKELLEGIANDQD